MNYNQILKKGENFLKKNKIQNPYLDVELILSKAVNRKREEILLNTNNKLKNDEIFRFNNYLSRRQQNEPIAYILGYKYFWKYRFLITPLEIVFVIDQKFPQKYHLIRTHLIYVMLNLFYDLLRDLVESCKF